MASIQSASLQATINQPSTPKRQNHSSFSSPSSPSLKRGATIRGIDTSREIFLSACNTPPAIDEKSKNELYRTSYVKILRGYYKELLKGIPVAKIETALESDHRFHVDVLLLLAESLEAYKTQLATVFKRPENEDIEKNEYIKLLSQEYPRIYNVFKNTFFTDPSNHLTEGDCDKNIEHFNFLLNVGVEVNSEFIQTLNTAIARRKELKATLDIFNSDDKAAQEAFKYIKEKEKSELVELERNKNILEIAKKSFDRITDSVIKSNISEIQKQLDNIINQIKEKEEEKKETFEQAKERYKKNFASLEVGINDSIKSLIRGMSGDLEDEEIVYKLQEKFASKFLAAFEKYLINECGITKDSIEEYTSKNPSDLKRLKVNIAASPELVKRYISENKSLQKVVHSEELEPYYILILLSHAKRVAKELVKEDEVVKSVIVEVCKTYSPEYPEDVALVISSKKTEHMFSGLRFEVHVKGVDVFKQTLQSLLEVDSSIGLGSDLPILLNQSVANARNVNLSHFVTYTNESDILFLEAFLGSETNLEAFKRLLPDRSVTSQTIKLEQFDSIQKGALALLAETECSGRGYVSDKDSRNALVNLYKALGEKYSGNNRAVADAKLRVVHDFMKNGIKITLTNFKDEAVENIVDRSFQEKEAKRQENLHKAEATRQESRRDVDKAAEMKRRAEEQVAAIKAKNEERRKEMERKKQLQQEIDRKPAALAAVVNSNTSNNTVDVGTESNANDDKRALLRKRMEEAKLMKAKGGNTRCL